MKFRKYYKNVCFAFVIRFYLVDKKIMNPLEVSNRAYHVVIPFQKNNQPHAKKGAEAKQRRLVTWHSILLRPSDRS